MWAIAYYPTLITAVYLALTLALFMLSTAIPIAGFLARLLISLVCLLIATSWGVVVSVCLRLVGYGRISQWATGRCFKYAMWFTAGVIFTIEDPNDYLGMTRPAVFIGNHQTELDVLMLGTIFPKYCSVTAKKSLKKIPFLGWFMTLSKSVFIDRQNSKSARDTMKGAAEEMQNARQSVFMFPEGTRSYAKDPVLLPFKKGAFYLAVKAKVPIVPIVIANYSDVFHVQSWRFNSGQIWVKVLQPIPTEKLTEADVEDLTRDTREVMLNELVSLTSKQRGHPVAMPPRMSMDGDGAVKASGIDTTMSRTAI